MTKAEAIEVLRRYLPPDLFAQVTEALEQDVKALHEALNDVLPLFVQDHGWEYTCVDASLRALARNRDRLPIRVVLAEKIHDEWDGS